MLVCHLWTTALACQAIDSAAVEGMTTDHRGTDRAAGRILIGPHSQEINTRLTARHADHASQTQYFEMPSDHRQY